MDRNIGGNIWSDAPGAANQTASLRDWEDSKNWINASKKDKKILLTQAQGIDIDGTQYWANRCYYKTSEGYLIQEEDKSWRVIPHITFSSVEGGEQKIAPDQIQAPFKYISRNKWPMLCDQENTPYITPGKTWPELREYWPTIWRVRRNGVTLFLKWFGIEWINTLPADIIPGLYQISRK